MNVLSVETLALTERPEDIEELALFFIAKATLENGLPNKSLSAEALHLLHAYHWPGNVRELQNFAERAVVFSDGDVIGPEAFPQIVAWVEDRERFDEALAEQAELEEDGYAEFAQGQWSPDGSEDSQAPLPARPQVAGRTPSLAEVERQYIAQILRQTGYNQSATARVLDVDRKRLGRLMKKYGLASKKS